MNTICRWYRDFLVWAFLSLGTKLFGVVVAERGDDDDNLVRAIHFAVTERDLNNSMRNYVEGLDR